MPGSVPPPPPRVLARAVTGQGEIVLRQAGAAYEIISNGMFLADTRDGRSERLLVSAALATCPATAPRLLIGGLGVGFSLAEAVGRPEVARIDVAEISAEIIGWHATHLRHLAAPAWDDARVTVINADLAVWLEHPRGPYDLICLDVDNGPTWTVTDANRVLYGDEGLHRMRASLGPEGVLAVWSASEAPDFERRLRRHFRDVGVHRVRVARGQPDVIYVGAGQRDRAAGRPGGARLCSLTAIGEAGGLSDESGSPFGAGRGVLPSGGPGGAQ